MSKEKEAKRAFWLQLYINGLIANGTRLKAYVHLCPSSGGGI